MKVSKNTSNLRWVKLSIVIPCYKSTHVLGEIVEKINSEFKNTRTLEIILVCDAGPKETWSAIQQIVLKSKNVRAFLLGQNVGQQSATKYGILKSHGNIVVTLDDDGQHNPIWIKSLISELQNRELDVIYGVPIKDEHGILRNFFSTAFKRLLSRLGLIPFARHMSSFRAFRKSLITNSSRIEDSDAPLDVLLASYTNQVGFIRVEMNKRSVGNSNYSFFQLYEYAFNLGIRSSQKPITLLSVVGMTGSVLSILLFFVTLILYSMSVIQVPGYTSIVLLLSFGFSINLWLLSALGKMVFSLLKNQQGTSGVWLRESIARED